MALKVIPTKVKIDGYDLTEEPVTCYWCYNSILMYVICEGYSDEVYEDGSWCATHHWRVLICSACNYTNVLSFTLWEHTEYIIGTDKNGKVIFDNAPTIYAIYPRRDLAVPPPHSDMPDGIKDDYEEAMRVFVESPRSAAALLRLVIQKLCIVLGGKGKNINQDVAFLVKNGLPKHVQRALDIVRVIGNESVHPGQIDVNDNRTTARELFSLVNEIVEEQIGRIKRHEKIDTLYDQLPQSKREQIQRRDEESSK